MLTDIPRITMADLVAREQKLGRALSMAVTTPLEQHALSDADGANAQETFLRNNDPLQERLRG